MCSLPRLADFVKSLALIIVVSTGQVVADGRERIATVRAAMPFDRHEPMNRRQYITRIFLTTPSPSSKIIKPFCTSILADVSAWSAIIDTSPCQNSNLGIVVVGRENENEKRKKKERRREGGEGDRKDYFAHQRNLFCAAKAPAFYIVSLDVAKLVAFVLLQPDDILSPRMITGLDFYLGI
ncbi:hypothetical protein F4824DRAFT_447815 [Ustulina deusta]|nr:hypothetical protein F4824DRAFT_447815 [Ustulina deusta]